MPKKMLRPFGEADCEAELRALGGKSHYSELYFDEAPFNEASIAPETYLIVGRRGSGKTALSQYFSFQSSYPNPIYIDVDEPIVYQQVLSDIASKTSEAREIAIPRLKRLWLYIIWCLIFDHCKNESPAIEGACNENRPSGRVSNFIGSILDRLLKSLHEDQTHHIGQCVEALLKEEKLDAARKEILKLTRKRPVIVSMDTLEKYDVNDKGLMNAMAALVQCAADFNLDYRDKGIHLKVFMSGEVFPFLKAEVIQNPLKSIKDPVYLFWRSKDLLRLISWRLYHHLKQQNILREESKGQIDWRNHREVRAKMWDPYFGNDVINGRGIQEDTLSYVLRHTQKRPRQVILLCNAIAQRGTATGKFPFLHDHIRDGIKSLETELAVEIINSYSSLYPRVSRIVGGLMNMPVLFTGNELDRRAHETASYWPPGTYSPPAFRNLVAELGIVGRVRRKTKAYTEAVFEYSLRDGLDLTHRDECAIHPMFFSKFNIQINTEPPVLPITLEPEQEDEELR
jgi:hypothetical protein